MDGKEQEPEKARSTIQELVRNRALMDAAVAQAVREAVLEHARLGFPVAEGRDGKVVWVPPEEILARFASESESKSITKTMLTGALRTILEVACFLILVGAGTALSFFALWARIDTTEDLWYIRGYDVVVGLLFAGAFLSARISGGVGPCAKNVPMTIAGFLAVWALVSLLLLFLHEGQVRVRRTIPPRFVALNRVTIAVNALEDYARDCGSYPSDEQGLGALCKNPGVAKWSGPYLRPEDLTDPWENTLRYKLRNNRPEVWSCGPDGQSGTDDDITAED